MERHMRLSRAAVVLVTIALIAAIAAAVWFASPDAPYVPSEDSGAALGAAAPAEDGYAEHETTVPSGYTGVYNASGVYAMRSEGRGSKADGGNYKYILMGNITIESIDLTAWTGEDGTPWKGELDGNGYTITINAATASGAYYDTGGLFSVIGGGANVHDLTIVVQNVRVDNNEGSANFGVIAGNACGTVTVDNVYIRLDKDSSGNGDAYVSSNGTTWLGGVFGKVEGSGVSIKNTTVYNSAEGSNGFSATINQENGVYVGGFVGSIDKGSLKMTNVVYKADANAKISAIAINNPSGLFVDDNTALVGGILGYHNEGSFELNGCIIDAAITLSSGFRTVNGDTAHAGYILGQVDSNLNDTWSSIYMNSSNGTTWLDGNNETRGTAVRYDKSVFADIRFADGEKVAVAVGKQSPANAGSIPRTITQGADTSKISDAEIAGAITEGSGTAWLTINKVNATTNVKMSVGDSVSTGNYNLTSPTISSVDGTTYKGSKEYDGTAYATPYITIGSEQINAWTADNTNADAGVKNFAYAGDSALTGYQVVSYANGDKYLVKNGTVYSPRTITIGGQSGQAFKLGNSFSYEITPASVTVTPNVPDNDLYTGNRLPELTATAVDSGGTVEGTIAWDDPNATLISGTHSYNWTWTPNSDNYQTVTSSIELEAFDRKIQRLTVQGDFKKAYTAYEPFDPTGVEVIAHYSDGSSAPLSNDEYEFTVVNGDINRLVVVNDTVTVSLKAGATVSTTFKIEVVKLTVDVPTEVAGLVYNGEEQIGVKNAEHYNLTGNTAEDAGDYVATAELKDKDNTEWSTGGTDNVTIPWSIAPMTLDGTVSAPDSLKYDGNAKDAAFDLTTGTLFDPDQVTIVYDADDRTNVTGEAVTATAQLPSSGNYKWATDAPSASFTIVPMPVVIGKTADLSKTYDGNVVDPKSLFTVPQGVDGQLTLTVTVDGGKTILNAGTYSVTASLAESETNYTADPVTITYTVETIKVSGSIAFTTSAIYDGTEKVAEFTLTSPDVLIGYDKVTITYSVEDRINVTGEEITATAVLPSGGNYAWADDAATSATFMITPKTVNVTATTGSKEFAWIRASASELYELFELDGEKVNAEDKLIWKVNGEEVDMSDGNVSEIFDAKEYKIEIASADANYTLVGTTSTTFTITPKKVEKPTVSDTREFTYNGGEQGFEIEENPEYEVKGDAKAANAGDYSFSIALKAPGNVVWSDGTTETITVSWKINKATFESVTIEFAEGALDNLFTSSAMPTPTTITADPTPLPAGVEGKFKWVESSLSEDTHIYNWTYTVPNYNVFEGTQELTAQAAVLESITLSGEYKTEYTAFDLFDVNSLVVTAYFDNGNGKESRVLSPDEYTLQSQSNIAQDGVPQLVVGDTYVIVTYQDKSVQIPVTVTAKVIELPEVIEELTYTGEPQTPFDWRGAGYESYYAFFEELSSYSYCDPSIVLRTDAGDFTFTLTINDDLGNNVVFENGQKTFEVASKILPKRVYLGHGDYTWGWFYGDNPVVADLGGNTGDDVAFVRAYDEDGNLIEDSLAFVAEEKTGLEQLVDAKEYTLVFTLADSVKNYQADAYEVVVSVARKPVQATLTAPDSVVYTGKEINAILTVTTTLVGEDKVTVAYNDDADCINYTGEEIVATAQLPNDNYEWADGAVTTVSFTIQKATIDNVTVTISEAPGGVWTTAMMPELTVVSVEPHVGGEVVWDNDSLIAGENKEQPWTFVPDSPNYEPYHGSVTLTVVQATLAGVSVEVVKTTEYVAFDAFDRSSIVVKALYGEGPKEITGYTLTFSGGSTEGRLLAGTGITVTVTYTDGDVTQYTEFTINVAKRTVAKPVVDTTVFDATGETITLPIAASEYYTVEGNTAIEPGRYVATVELKDAVNTMWADGSTEDVKIAWTISEPVTSGEVIADILAMEKVTWQNAEEFLDLEARYNALDKSEQTAEATAKLEVLRAQYDALRNAAFDDIEAAHEVTAKSLGKALAAAAAGLSAAAIALAIAKRRSI